MNGRVYDPRIGRFVSADPIVQAPFHSQSYNRYSYVFNSPLSLADPSGYAPVKPTGPKCIECYVAGAFAATLFGAPPLVAGLVGSLFSALFGGDSSGTGGGGSGSLSGMASVGVMGDGGGGSAKEGGFLAGAMGSQLPPSAAPERVDASWAGIGVADRDVYDNPIDRYLDGVFDSADAMLFSRTAYPFNAMKAAVGLFNLTSGVRRAAMSVPGLAFGNPASMMFAAFGLGGASRGAQQLGESRLDKHPSSRNVLGLLPWGQMFDDRSEPGPVAYALSIKQHALSDPWGAAKRAIRDFFAM